MNKPVAAPVTHAYAGPEHGLIYGFAFDHEGSAQPLPLDHLSAELALPDRTVWLHFNAANTNTQRWLAQCRLLPDAVCEVIDSHETRVRFEPAGEGLLAVLNDLAYQDSMDPSVIATLWVYASARVVITVRNHAAKSADALRLAARRGLNVRSGFDVLNRLLEVQNEVLQDWVAEIAKQVDHAEDQVVSEQVSGQRERLGRIRRLCLYLRRHFAPQRAALQRFLAHPPAGGPDVDLANLRSLCEDLGFVIDESVGLQERAKLLQEELSAQAAEQTGRNLYVLTITTLILLPMTLVTGIFGMNIAGVPGVGETVSNSAFWWVLLSILAVGALTLCFLKLRKMI
jgi:zinc transporter